MAEETVVGKPIFVRINRWAGALGVVNPVGDIVELPEELAKRIISDKHELGAYGHKVDKPSKEAK